MGVGISRYIYSKLQISAGNEINDHQLIAFQFFIGTVMAISAFPVLARIMLEKDKNLINTDIGIVSLGSGMSSLL
jgi:Kef-type K+ transport system membrane component KefB